MKLNMSLASGPYKELGHAREVAFNSVDPPLTLWVVVELFGEGFDRKAADGSGETWGELWVVPDEMVDAFAEAKGAESRQVVDSYGYDSTDIDPIGPIEDSGLPADENGWDREEVWYGDQSMGDDAISLGYLALYRNGNQRVGLIYYVSKANNDEDRFEVQLITNTYEVDENDEIVDSTDEYDYSYPFDFAADSYNEALRWARNAALGDERFKLLTVGKAS